VLILDVGTLMGSLVGQTEERTRQALQIADAMAPCVVMIDEVEKAFAGVGNSGQTDNGFSSHMFVSLSWLNDHDSDVFVVCTANDVAKLPPEFGQAERCDAIFFLGFSGRDQKTQVLIRPKKVGGVSERTTWAYSHLSLHSCFGS
jgi:SpoVK/Ycf46/Vps4 family AAA+-type ATPase